MADVQVIVNRIAQDAQTQADAIVAAAREKAEQAVAAARAAAQEERARTADALEAEGRELLARKKTVAALEVRKVRLGALTQAIDRVYALALDKLCAMGEKEQLALIESLLCAYAEQGDEVVLNGTLPEERVRALKVCKERGLTLAAERGTHRGGVVLVGKTYDKDLTFESLLATVRPETESEVLRLIGGEN